MALYRISLLSWSFTGRRTRIDQFDLEVDALDFWPRESRKPSTSGYRSCWVMLTTKQNRNLNCPLLNAEEHASIDCSSLPPDLYTAHQGYSTLSLRKDSLSRMQPSPRLHQCPSKPISHKLICDLFAWFTLGRRG